MYMQEIRERGVLFMKYKRIFWGAGCLIAFLCYIGINDYKTRYNLLLPSLEEVQENGYAINEYGQTYGPYLGYGPEPDLIRAKGISVNGDKIFGYINLSENDEPKTLEEVLAYTADKDVNSSWNLYTQDGRTIIGTFPYVKSNN